MTSHPTAQHDSLLRDKTAPHHGRVGFVELFFDLVFVFAVTQLSHHLLHDPTLEGAAQTALLLLAVWTVWVYTTWAANWIDCERGPARIMLFGMMAGGLVMSAALPEAFEGRGAIFAIAYAAMQVGRTVFMLYALKDAPQNERANFVRILVWLATASALWIVGGFVEGVSRCGFWIAALCLELGGPWFRFRVPGMGASSTADWSIDPEHMAERCGLFVIIALGESIIVTGATFAGLQWSFEVCLAFGSALLATVAMWWVYFVLSAEVARDAFTHHKDPGAVARAAYTFGHVPIVAGIIVTAVSDELILAHPTGHLSDVALVVTLLGPALFLFGAGLFCWLVFAEPPISPVIGMVMLAGLWFFAPHMQPVAVSVGSTIVLIFVAAWESVAQMREKALA
ncbi:MAG: low temperature requirement protein A [Hyphomonadaceae bacterium]